MRFDCGGNAFGYRHETAERTVTAAVTGGGGGCGYITVTGDTDQAYAVPMEATPQ